MSIDVIEYLVIKFLVQVIEHKFYLSSQLNNVSFTLVDLGYKIIKKDHSSDLAKLS